MTWSGWQILLLFAASGIIVGYLKDIKNDLNERLGGIEKQLIDIQNHYLRDINNDLGIIEHKLNKLDDIEFDLNSINHHILGPSEDYSDLGDSGE